MACLDGLEDVLLDEEEADEDEHEEAGELRVGAVREVLGPDARAEHQLRQTRRERRRHRRLLQLLVALVLIALLPAHTCTPAHT